MAVYQQLTSSFELSEILRVDSPYHRYIEAVYFGSGSAPIGQSVKTVTFNLKKYGSPTGTLYFRAYTFDASGSGTLNHTWGSLDVADDMDNTKQDYTVTGDPYTLQTNDCVGAYLSGGSTSASDYIAINGKVEDLSPIQAAEFDGGDPTPAWVVNPNVNPYAIMLGTAVSSGTFLPPPPAYVRL